MPETTTTTTPERLVRELRKTPRGGPRVFFGREYATLADAIERAERENEADTAYWEDVATGQDSEEAEASGYLVGYAAGLRDAARILLGHDATEAGERAGADTHCMCGRELRADGTCGDGGAFCG